MSRVRVPAALRREVSERANGCCEYCGANERFSAVGFHCEHIIPVQHGGEATIGNLALSCPACNFRKGTNLSAIDPLSGEVIAIFHPRRDSWSAHFSFHNGELLPLTPTGRATVRLLSINSPERIAAREFEAKSQA